MTLAVNDWRERVLATLPDEVRGRLEWVEAKMPRCESELERIFLILFAIVHRDFTNFTYAGEAPPDGELSGRRFLANFEQQVKLAGYRCDFLLTITALSTGRVLRIAIECDGHSFHDRTPEQASRDRRRDRALIAEGVPTLRYTYSDLARDPSGSIMDFARTFKAIVTNFCDREGGE